MGILNVVTAENTDTNTHIHLEGKSLKEIEREVETDLSWNSTRFKWNQTETVVLVWYKKSGPLQIQVNFKPLISSTIYQLLWGKMEYKFCYECDTTFFENGYLIGLLSS